MTEKIQKLKELIKESNHLVALTGAGISTESGISDYRSQGGLWQRYQPVTLQEFLADEESRKLYWQRKKETYEQMRGAKPNAGHLALAKLEASGKLKTLITQNIDGLHQDAGSEKVLEIHGTGRLVGCLKCEYVEDSENTYACILKGTEIPLCPECEGLLKPRTISFGQNLDADILYKSFEAAKKSDLFLAIGSTLVVEPAASLPRLAREHGADIVVINRDPTPMDSHAALVFHDSISEVLGRLF